MWSKTRQILEERLPEDLRGRVRYQYEVHRNGTAEQQVLSIFVDGNLWFATSPKMQAVMDLTMQDGVDTTTREEVIKQTGLLDNSFGEAMEQVHEFLNVLSIEEAISHKNYFIRLLALLDSRLGKRRVKKLLAGIESEPEWFKKWILLRAGVQEY